MTSLSIIPSAPTLCLSTHKSATQSVHPTASLSVIPICPSYEQSVHPPVTPSMTHQSATPPVSPVNHPSECPSPSNHLYTILPQPSDHLPPSHHLYGAPISPSACLSPVNCLADTTTCLPVRPSSTMIHRTQNPSQSLAVVNREQPHTIHRTQDSSQSLAVVNGEQSRKAKKFHRAFPNYDLLLSALDASSIYLRDCKHVAPPKSGEDAHVTHGRCDFGGTTLNKPSLCFSYVIPRLWDPGGVRSLSNVSRDRSRALAPSRYPYTSHMGHLVKLPNLQQWQSLRTSHMKLNIFIQKNITGLNITMKKTARSINIIVPTLT